ncbi:MAG TPA: hypothetical protein ENJ87_02575 [Gammaproteobacteria bacterium]|nr:hypothetical protein [Gammaproteobacteria bacterium]
MPLINLQAERYTLALFAILSSFTNSTPAAEDQGSVGLTNFAFSHYLGTGFYSSSGQDVFVVQAPFKYTITEKTNTEPGWVVNLPLTLGIINSDTIDVNNLPGLNDVTTLTFLPGIEYQYPVTHNWTISPFGDFGIARDLNNLTSVFVTGIGIKSYYNIPVNDAMITLGNRFLYAREKSKNNKNESDYSLIETGINYRVASSYSPGGRLMFSNLYYINLFYPNNLVLLERTENSIRIGIEHEIGITFSNLPDFLFFEKSEIGVGIRFSSGVKVFRIIFGMPF